MMACNWESSSCNKEWPLQRMALTNGFWCIGQEKGETSRELTSLALELKRKEMDIDWRSWGLAPPQKDCSRSRCVGSGGAWPAKTNGRDGLPSNPRGRGPESPLHKATDHNRTTSLYDSRTEGQGQELPRKSQGFLSRENDERWTVWKGSMKSSRELP